MSWDDKIQHLIPRPTLCTGPLRRTHGLRAALSGIDLGTLAERPGDSATDRWKVLLWRILLLWWLSLWWCLEFVSLLDGRLHRGGTGRLGLASDFDHSRWRYLGPQKAQELSQNVLVLASSLSRALAALSSEEILVQTASDSSPAISRCYGGIRHQNVRTVVRHIVTVEGMYRCDDDRARTASIPTTTLTVLLYCSVDFFAYLLLYIFGVCVLSSFSV